MDSAVASAIAAGVSAVAASIGLILSFFGFRAQARALDAASYLSILERFQENERKLAATDWDDDQRSFIIREHFNFLEGVTHLYNTGRLPGKTREMCKDILINHIAALHTSKEAVFLFEMSVTNVDTYAEIGKFLRENKAEIEARVAIFTRLQEGADSR